MARKKSDGANLPLTNAQQRASKRARFQDEAGMLAALEAGMHVAARLHLRLRLLLEASLGRSKKSAAMR